jgi:protein LSM14
MLNANSSQAALLKDKRIRIITISEIRYEGTLYQINTKDKTIALKNVVAFGTEERRVDQVIPPSQNVYELIIFKASHIKDINVLSQEEETKSQVAKKEEIVEKAPEVEKKPAQPAEEPVKEEAAPLTTPDNKYPEEEDREYERRRSSSHGRSQGKYGGHNNHRRYQGHQGGQGPHGGRRGEKGPKDFDFDEMVEKNNLLEKEKEEKEGKEDKEAKYVFDDFFDTLTTSVNDKGEGGKKDPYQQYKTNSETFGYVKRGGQRGGHRGRGGYGGRGGYQGDRHGGGGGYRDNRDRDIDYEDYKGGRGRDTYKRGYNDDRRDQYYPKESDGQGQSYGRGGRGGGGYRGGRSGYRSDYNDGDRFYEKKN